MTPSNRHRRTSASGQRGQIAPVALFGVLIASAVLVMMYNTGQKVTEKSQVANAADAAAYSGAVWTARHLNFMAYTNRAMIANHAAVGHLVSYVSWIRYIHDSIEYVDRITRYIPYVGQYVATVEQIAEQVREGVEETADVVIPAIDGWNANFRAAQIETQASLALNNLDELMQQTARAWDPQIRINDRGEIDRLPDELRAVVELQLLQQLAGVPMFVERYTAGSDDGAVSELISASLTANTDMRRWITGERGWRENLIVAQIRKQGSTTHMQDENGADWRAQDQLQYRTRSLFGWGRWRRIGDETSEASATEFARNYQGVPSYYNVAGNPGDQSLSIAALATKRQTQVNTRTNFGMDANTQPLAVAAMARVEFRRPSGNAFASLGNDRHEYANLFNPFWDARLVPVESGIGL
ncbi:MAG TPA: pilus assembly protein TadG-related protein [Povalibacter sp.]|uniref:pilus assembly protein TadG-related protein n=1 Tax=Povalibacter sp. TaxID=1962978 RepID=UPI002BDF00E4|nr:pilus assembly protein TadG-related protein [Povalibacter sp.]HMN46339.1 pilus assembly protein TadG-related protein [Povalibacter sp.]